MGAETQISQLVLEVSAQTALAQRSLNDLARVVQSSTGQMNASLSTVPTTMKRIESSFAGLKSTITGLFAGLVVGGLEESIRHSLEYAGSLAEVARTLGVTTKDLQTFRYAATQSGVAQDQLEVGLRRLTVSMGKAQLGSAAQAKAFQAIGISVDQLKGKDTGDVFRLMADGLSNVSDRSQRAAIEMTLMGRSGSTLDNLLAPGSKRLNDLADAAQRLGIVLSDQQIQKAEETAHKLEALKEVLGARIAGVVADNANAILSLSNALIELVSHTGQAIEGWRRMMAEFRSGIPVLANLPNPLDAARGLAGDPASLLKFGKSLFNTPKTLGQYNQTAAQGVNQLITAETWANIRAGTAALTTHAARPTGGDLSQYLGGGGGGRGHRATGGGSSTGTKIDPAQQADEFAREEAEIDAQILAAKKQLTVDYNQQADIAQQELQADTASKLASIQKQVDQKRITAAAGKTLSAKEQEAAAAKSAVIEQLRVVKALEAQQQAEDQRYQFAIDDLRFADEMATTNAERRKVQLAILDLQYQTKQVDLELLLKRQQELHDFDGAALTQAQIDRLPTDKAHDQQRVEQGTLNPLEQWAKSVPHDAATIKEALQSIEAQGLDGLASAIGDVISGTKSLQAAFKDVAQSIIADIVQMTIKMLIFRALSSVFGGIFGNNGSGLGQSLFPVVNGVDPLAALPGRAVGGPVSSGSPYIVGEKGPELFVPNASGMIVPNASRIPAPRAANSNAPAQVVEIRVATDENFHAEVAQVAGAVMVHAAPVLVNSAQKSTVKALTRPAITGRR